MNQARVLVVEDDRSLREALCETLEMAGYPVTAAQDGRAALSLVERGGVGMVVSDVQMESMDGHVLLQQIKAKYPDLPVVLMTAYGTVEKAVQAMRDGASDYLVKPFEAEILVNMVSRYFGTGTQEETATSSLIATDERMIETVALAERVARTDVTVLISGESGTGKEIFARHIHRFSKRCENPFIAINCAAIPENMLEAVLFGYEKGAFTGAYQASPGKFEQAQGGTLLLDEISEMDLGLQAKLLRVLQEREVERLGGRKVIALDVRVIATTNRNLRQEVEAGRFREDLYYRLNVFPIKLMALRERHSDVLPLARYLVERHTAPDGIVPRFTPQAEVKLQSYDWPGNVRELDNVIQRALILSNGTYIDETCICFESPTYSSGTKSESTVVPFRSESALGDDLRNREYQLILSAIKECNGSRKAAAEHLRISPRTLRYKLAKMRESGIVVPDGDED